MYAASVVGPCREAFQTTLSIEREASQAGRAVDDDDALRGGDDESTSVDAGGDESCSRHEFPRTQPIYLVRRLFLSLCEAPDFSDVAAKTMTFVLERLAEECPLGRPST